MGDDGIVLSDREREALAGLAEQIGDPWLARQLAGGEPPPPRRNRLAGVRDALLRRTGGWVGLVLVVAGALLTLVTFTRSIPLGAAGLALMGFGAWRVAADKGDDLILRLKTARQTHSGRKTPPPPRTPPAGA